MQQGMKSKDYVISHSRNVTHHCITSYIKGVKCIALAVPLGK